MNKPTEPTTCTVNGNLVSATGGLPVGEGEVINFFVHDETSGKTTGWVLGMSEDGTWPDVAVPDRTGPTTYEFTSKTWGKGGKQYTVFATCEAE